MKRFTKIVSVVLAFFVVFSTLSFTIDKHYCGDFLVDIAVFGEADDCGMQMAKSSKKKSCCKDEKITFEGQDLLPLQKVDQLSFDEQLFITAIFAVTEFQFFYLEKNEIPFKAFPPPDIPLDFQSEFQTYLI
ncbi:MAG: hypothetical protein CMB99_11250 [Flavobacteriaceae bacterium]|nr:hypothetical protein [Flavobacteriaceae bacterium]|tara:strand:- start:72058 stop:72453 length:396 start_codon:yes stop_codon:yes gene_type:complete